MKKTVSALCAIILACVLLFSFAACGEGKSPSSSDDNSGNNLTPAEKAMLNFLYDKSSESSLNSLANTLMQYLYFNSEVYLNSNETEMVLDPSNASTMLNDFVDEESLEDYNFVTTKATNPATYKSSNSLNNTNVFFDVKSDRIELTVTSSQNSSEIIGYSVSYNGSDFVCTKISTISLTQQYSPSNS